MKFKSSHEQMNFCLLGLLIVFFPLHIKITNTILIVFGLHWVVWVFRQPNKFLWKNNMLWLLLVPYVLSSISLLYTTNVGEGIYILDKKAALFILPLALGTMPKIEIRRFNWLMEIATVSMVIALLICFSLAIYKTYNDIPGAFFWREFASPLNGLHPTYLSLYLNLLISYLGFSNFREDKSKKTGALIIIIIFFIAQILLSSKIQLLISAVIFLIILFKYLGKENIRLAFFSLLILVLLLASFIRSSYTWERFISISSIEYKLDDAPQTFNELTIRLGILECAAEIIRQNLLLGVGAGDVNDELDKVYRKYDFKFGYLDKLNPHNEYLSQLLSIGLFGCVIFIMTLVFLFKIAFIKKDSLYMIFLILVVLSFMFESMLERQVGIIFFAVFNSLFLFHRDMAKTPSSTSS